MLVLRQILTEINVRHDRRPYGSWFQEELIRAMLTVSTYKHGNRSLRTIVNMCVRFGGDDGKYVTASLPPAHQLDMHVDGKEFLSRVEEARKELKAELSRAIKSRTAPATLKAKFETTEIPSERAQIWAEAQKDQPEQEIFKLVGSLTGKTVASLEEADRAMDMIIQPKNCAEIVEAAPSATQADAATTTPKRKGSARKP